MRNFWLLLVLSVLTACAGMAERPSPEPQNLASIDDFLAHQDYLRAGLQDGSIGDLSARELEEVIDRQNELRALLSDVETVEELSEEDRVRVLNAQNTINGILTRNLRDTPICRREHVTGSHRQRTVCLTPRQRQELAEAARQGLQFFFRSHLRPPSDG